MVSFILDSSLVLLFQVRSLYLKDLVYKKCDETAAIKIMIEYAFYNGEQFVGHSVTMYILLCFRR